MFLERLILLWAAQNIDVSNEEKLAPPINFGMSFPEPFSERKLVNEFFDADDRPNLSTVLGATVSLNPNFTPVVTSDIASPFPALQLLKGLGLESSLLGNGFVVRGQLKHNPNMRGAGVRRPNLQPSLRDLSCLEDCLGLLHCFVPSTIFPSTDGKLQFLFDVTFTGWRGAAGTGRAGAN